ncbi:MAG: MinD/ParA family protein [Anaerolineae bacterium]|nr:MinD/ParA family protein [Anaerolineae bacterium]
MIGLREHSRQASGLVGLRPPASPACRQTRALAVASGKGGVGKTSIAVNLGLALARRGTRVLLFDGDLGLANADVLLGLRPERTLRDVVVGRCRLSEVLIEAEAGLHLAPGGSGLAELLHLDEAGRRELLLELGELERSYDFVLMDLAAGLGRDVVRLLAHAGEVLVVTTPEPTALTDAYALVKVAHRGPGDNRFGLVVNLANNELDGREAACRLQRVARAFLDLALPLRGILPNCAQVPESVRSQTPTLTAFPRSPFSVAVRALAGELAGQPEPASQGEGVAALLRAWFAGTGPWRRSRAVPGAASTGARREEVNL